MRRSLIIGAVVAGSLVAGALGYMGASGRLSNARTQELERIGRFIDFLERVRAERQARPAVDARIKSVANRTLGPNAETVDSGLRSRLNRIGEELQLTDLQVATEAEKERILSPARSEMTRLDRTLREQPDWVEVRGVISGEGSLDQAMRLIHRLEVEPWIKRLDQVRLDPGRTGERVRVVVRLTTLFLEGVIGQPVPPPSAEAMSTYARYQPFVQRNPFRLPPPPPAPQPAVVQKPAPRPPGFPWNQWKVTGRLDGPLGVEACLRNVATNATLTLAPGTRISDAEFIGFEIDAALFKMADALFLVELGATMDQRRDFSP
ncbi:MAG: hypothetical protein KF724_00600 [Phycisphaeraceae bacterium]|nr:hypothetical protein [Phycisphaeraceae bacterium]